ncbi:hypothetical protein R6Q59_029281 [Mikania micrantha]
MQLLVPSFTCVFGWSFRHDHRLHSRLKIRAQSLGDDEEGSSNLVDSNMKTLKDRIKVIRAKERLVTISRLYGRDYDSNYTSIKKKQDDGLKMVALICSTLSIPVLTGMALLYIFSVVTHLGLRWYFISNPS